MHGASAMGTPSSIQDSSLVAVRFLSPPRVVSTHGRSLWITSDHGNLLTVGYAITTYV